MRKWGDGIHFIVWHGRAPAVLRRRLCRARRSRSGDKENERVVARRGQPPPWMKAWPARASAAPRERSRRGGRLPLTLCKKKVRSIAFLKKTTYSFQVLLFFE